MIPHHRISLSFLCVCLTLVACNNADSSTAKKTSLESQSLSDTNSTDANLSVAVTIDSEQSVVDALNTNLKTSGIEQKVTSAVPTDMPGLYWVTAEGMPPFFTNKSGEFILQGQLVKIGDAQPVDISAKFQARMASQALANVPKEEMIIYPAKGETKAVVYAFTDADCGYCRKLHSEMDDINAEGIELRYLAWPRGEQTFPKMQAIWCSDNQKAAMDAAKAGDNVSAPDCDNPVQKHFDLGASLGVRGTPAIYTTSGQQIGGYLPARQLAKAAIDNQ